MPAYPATVLPPSKQQEFPQKIHVCTAAACLSQRSDKVKAGIEARIKEKGLEKSCHVKGVGCMGLCAAGPLVSVESQGRLYQDVQPGEIVTTRGHRGLARRRTSPAFGT